MLLSSKGLVYFSGHVLITERTQMESLKSDDNLRSLNLNQSQV